MKYLYCKKQIGQGCDYTIGCGMVYGIIEAQSIEEAIEEIIYPSGRDECSALEGEMSLEEIFLVPAENVTKVDIETKREEIENERKRQAAETEKEKELSELKRLQNKYGD